MMKLADYYQPVVVNNTVVNANCKAYCMDRQQKNDKFNMAKHVGLNSCAHCDYFVFGKQSVIFMELTSNLDMKETLRNKYSEVKWNEIPDSADMNKLMSACFHESVANENMVKMYGSMVILCWFAQKCQDMCKKFYERREYEFWLIIDEDRKDIKGIDKMKKRLQDKLCGSSGKQFNVKAKIFSSDKIETEIKKHAVAAA